MTPNTPAKFRIENIAPILYVSDMEKSLAFYVDILGFKKADWGDDNFTSINRDNTGLYLCKGAQGVPGTWVWLGFDGDITELNETLKSRGVIIKLPPTNFSWAYEMQIQDPDGHVLRLGTDPDNQKPFADR
ncbi:MAG TPA: glyoxalase superfamily protein [Cyclobacteriaceae bacterium]|nr:VOC family protein [Cyclobacteriaceae bacterium]HMV09422.1 glyoxalase superfamily protein [Cyclobacteriaceae bacterium]HMV91467.1 glyoxalase superfamily protein [Cyclobacteriaceae bacterium]HMX02443.1 glyoxalase superfamily protein [Cyclobacteriaceae bacterium]HMX51069.1 glyoxalase superfamily protein [Cyclobacteriaceae bacterium]